MEEEINFISDFFSFFLRPSRALFGEWVKMVTYLFANILILKETIINPLNSRSKKCENRVEYPRIF